MYRRIMSSTLQCNTFTKHTSTFTRSREDEYISLVWYNSTSVVKLFFFLENSFMNKFFDEIELFLEKKKVFGKIASPTTSYIDEREKRGRELQ